MQRIIYTLVLLNITFLCGAQKKSVSIKSLIGNIRARQIGPAVMSGRVSTIAVVNNTPEIVYVGAGGGGVWKSQSGGVTFRPIFDDYTQSIGKIAIDQAHPDTVWVGTGEPWVRNSVSVGTGIYKSTNGGTSWKHMGLKDSERISDIIIHPDHPDTVFVGVQGHLWDANEERGVYKTTDGGKTWEKVLYIDENTGCADLDIDPNNPDIIYAAMWSHRRRPWDFDSGLNGKSGLYKSTDGGITWDTIHNGLPQEKLGRIGIGVAPSDGNVVYATVECKTQEAKGIYRSTDQGESWTHTNNEFNAVARPFYFSNIVVDPKNDSIVAKCGVQMIISEDGGQAFRTMDFSVHSDVHDVWFDPNNPKHIILASDGGVYESFDRGYTFRMWTNLPLAQYYRISIDNEEPYNIYGGLQDNGSWYGPSRKAGGITNADWKSIFGGDGFYAFRHPTEKDVIFCEFQGGNIIRYNEKTGNVKWIRPYPEGDEGKYRFNWNSPIHISPNHPERIYFGSQYLFMSDDMGESWQRISPDLTTNDPDKQQQNKSGGISIDNSTAENHCTIYWIAESYSDDNTVWVGTDDGQLQFTKDLGKTWTNVIDNVPDLPKNTWVTYVETSHHDPNTVYVTFDGHRTGDKKTYLYKTTDLGKTWTNIAKDEIDGYALSVREDPVNPNLLFLGTEFGLYVTMDGGGSWGHLTNNLPKVGIRDMVIHPTKPTVILGTHGRGVIVLDDISPLREYSEDMIGQKLSFFESKPTIMRDPGSGGGWFGGSGSFVGPNPSSAAKIAYFMDRRHTFGKMYIEVYKDGELVKTIPAGKSAGINIVEMPTSMERPKAPPTKNRMALVGSVFAPNLEDGKYDVKVIKGRDTFPTYFELAYDEKSPYTKEERATQRETVMELYDMIEEMAYIYLIMEEIESGAKGVDIDKSDLQKMLDDIADKAKVKRGALVSQEGDFYVAEEEMLYEKISDLFRAVSSYPGKPSNSQLKQSLKLSEDMETAQEDIETFIEKELGEVNKALEAAGRKPISFSSFTDFKANKVTRKGNKNKP